MKQCKYCKSMIDKKAKVCPNCNKKQKVPGCLVAIIIFLLLLLLGSCSSNEDNDIKDKDSVTKSKATTEETTTVETTTKNPEISKEEFISQCQSITYNDIARNPDNYKGTKAVFTGEVVQVTEGWFNSVIMRVNVTKGSYEIWDDTVYVTYTYADGESKILEDDIITMYGTLKGSETYTTVLGASVTIPKFEAKYINLN